MSGAAARAADVVVVGAGGAGMMCAREAGLRGRKVLLLDHAEKLGRKILVSGGGRCNFTNVLASPAQYVSRNPPFCVSALSRYSPEDFIALVEAHGIRYHEKKLGQLFCDDSAARIVALLTVECAAAGVETVTACRVERVTKGEGGFRLETSQGAFAAPALVVATGGLSISKTGATGWGFDLARQFGHAVIAPEPALVGLRWNDDEVRGWVDLAGVAVQDTTVTCNGVTFREAILFTHSGLSGPAILQASLYWKPGDAIEIDLLPASNVLGWLNEKRTTEGAAPLSFFLADGLPKRLAARLCEAHLPPGPLARMSDAQFAAVDARLKRWRVVPAATEGWEKAEVTRGGVDTTELSSKSMESRKVPGLYFIGEVVDVTGWLGGYNFQWAWASGAAAGRAV